MATQTFGTDRTVLLPHPGFPFPEDDCEAEEPEGGAFRGFAFAMLFNLALALTAVAAWQLWRLLR